MQILCGFEKFFLGNKTITVIGGLKDGNLKEMFEKQEIFIPNYYYFKNYYKDWLIS